MSDATDKEAAFNELIRMCEPDGEPRLTAFELLEILENNQRARRWATATALTLGTVIMPNTRNGHVYKVIEAGTTGATEPTWPTGTDDTVVDGTVTLIEAGVDFSNVFNIRAAKEQAAALKEIKSAELHEDAEGKIRDHWREIRKSNASVLIA